MKTSEFKKLIKEAVREGIREEMKDILLEAIKTPKSNINENMIFQNTKKPSIDPIEQRKSYLDIVNNMKNGQDEINFTTNNLVKVSGPIDTTTEGSALPSGEISMDMIMNLTNRK